MHVMEILLFLIVNIFYIFIGMRYFTVFFKRHRKKRFIFFMAWGMLWALVQLLYGYLLTGSDRVQIFSGVVICLVLLVSAVIFNLYDKIWQETDEKIKSIMYQQQIEYYTREYQSISRKQDETRKMRHEMKNNYILLKALAEKGDTQGIIKYINQMNSETEERATARSGNMVVDAVINYKIAMSRQDEIDFHLRLNIPTEFDTNDVKLCGLLGNAIDNAVEACVRLPKEKRKISITMEVQKRNLFIEIRNPYDGTLLKNEKGRLMTRKENAANHGFGLSIMEELLGNNFGTMETVWDDETFCLRIILYVVL